MQRQLLRHTWLVIQVLGWVALPAFASADDDWLHEFDEAVAAAKQQGKDILIDFSGKDWCLPCRRLWKETLSQREFIELAAPHFVLLDIDNLAVEAMPKGRKNAMRRCKSGTQSRHSQRSCWLRPMDCPTQRRVW